MRFPIQILLACALAGCGGLAAQAPVWPVPGDAPGRGAAITGFVQPTASGKPESGLFGCSRSDGYRFHEALDIAPVLERRKGEATDPVTAIHDGVVTHICRVAGNSSFGRYVVLEHPGLDLAVFSLYAHLASVADGLKVGQIVAAGTPLGIMGRSASYSIPRDRAHLHLEVGLRLSDDFGAWYNLQKYEEKNQHGNFNGMNLVGWDPLDYFAAFRDRKVKSTLRYLEQIRPAVMLHVRTSRRPDFADRYPELVLRGCPPGETAGWEVLLSGWGLPLSIKPLSRSELIGVSKTGDISVVSVDRDAVKDYACRKVVTFSGDKVNPGTHTRTLMEIMFRLGKTGK